MFFFPFVLALHISKGLYWCCNSHLIMSIWIPVNIPGHLLQCYEFILSCAFLIFASGNLNTSELPLIWQQLKYKPIFFILIRSIWSYKLKLLGTSVSHAIVLLCTSLSSLTSSSCWPDIQLCWTQLLSTRMLSLSQAP